jgi:hypothetical protein
VVDLLPSKSEALLVVCACHPSYSGDRDEEDRGSKPTQANSSRDPIVKKNLSQKRASGVGLKR